MNIIQTITVKKAFTFIEVVVAIGIFATLFAIASPNIFKIKDRADLSTTMTMFISDFKQQQLKAMSGSSDPTEILGNSYGLHIEANKYVLFKGSEYNPEQASNIYITVNPPLEFNPVLLPSSQIIFASGSGEVVLFNQNNNNVTLKNTITNEGRKVQFNRFGVITEVSSL